MRTRSRVPSPAAVPAAFSAETCIECTASPGAEDIAVSSQRNDTLGCALRAAERSLVSAARDAEGEALVQRRKWSRLLIGIICPPLALLVVIGVRLLLLAAEANRRSQGVVAGFCYGYCC